MEEIGKLPKGNRIFVSNPIVLEFIEYCKEKYSKDIRNINLSLYDEEDAEENEWQLTVKETSENREQGLVWVAWHIPSNPVVKIDDIQISNLKVIGSRYKKVDGKDV